METTGKKVHVFGNAKLGVGASNHGANDRAGNVPAVHRGESFYAQEAFLRSRAASCEVTSFATFETQRESVLPLASLLMAELRAPEAPRYDHPMSHSTGCHPNLEVR